MAAPPLDTLQRTGNLSRGHQNTHKILKRKKRTDTKYDKKARFDGQRFGKLKVATWNVRGIAEKMEELQTELLKRKNNIISEMCALQIWIHLLIFVFCNPQMVTCISHCFGLF